MTLQIDIHIIQSVPPSNMNRDDTGSPKTAFYGGVRRARVSSQAWKRATRKDFAAYLDASAVGVRTKRAVELLTARIQKLRPETELADAQKMAMETLKVVNIGTKPTRRAKDTPAEAEQTEYLIFYSNLQLDRVAELAVASLDGPLDKKAVKDALNADNSFDVALFGRMVANAPDINVDAACQVAHALSTHAVANEFDYYTAVDDQNPKDETGAGMIGTVEFNSATLYRYATVNVRALADNLGDPEATARAVQAFVRSFVYSMPTGKQNTFANGTLPDAVVVMAREGRAVNLVGAFEDPVTSASGGFASASVEALARQAKEVTQFVPAPTDTWVVTLPSRASALADLGDIVSLDALVELVGERVRAAVPDPS